MSLFTLVLEPYGHALRVVGRDAWDPVFGPGTRQLLGQRLQLLTPNYEDRDVPPIFMIRPLPGEGATIYTHEKAHPDPLVIARFGVLFLRLEIDKPEERVQRTGGSSIHRDRLVATTDEIIDNPIRPPSSDRLAHYRYGPVEVALMDHLILY